MKAPLPLVNLLLCGLLLSGGCATVVPMQTASVVAPGRWRTGGQVSAAAFCGAIPKGGAGLLSCTELPDGVPLPEMRVGVRRGLGSGMDVAGSLQVQGTLMSPERPLQVGTTLEGKRELLRIPGGEGRTHVLSAGLLAGGAVAGRAALPPWLQVEGGVPLFYGLQTEQLEWVAGISYTARVLVPQVGSENPVGPMRSHHVGAVLGVHRRAPSAWAVQLGYLVDTRQLATGSIQLQFGWFLDFGEDS